MTQVRLALVFLALLAGCSLVGRPFELAPAPSEAPASVGEAEDLVYVGELGVRNFEFATATLRALAMPSGRDVRYLDVQAHPGTGVVPGARMAYFPVNRQEGERAWRTALERVDLATGATASRIDAGSMPFAGSIGARGRVLLVTTSDGRVLLVRSAVEDAAAVRLDLFEESGALRATRVVPGPVDAVVHPTVAFAGGGRYALRLAYTNDRPYTLDWLLLDDELRLLRRIERVPTGAESEWPGGCYRELRAIPGRSEWVTLCQTTLRSWAQFIDPKDLSAIARVDLPDINETGQPQAWNVAPDGTLVVVTERPWLVRVDTVTRKLVDARPVALPSALRIELFAPQVALAKMYVNPAVQFSADGTRIYLAPFAADFPLAWQRGVSVIDVPSAALVQYLLRDEELRGIHLSPDGARLYALMNEQKGGASGEVRLVALDVGSGAVLARSAVLPKPAFEIITVARAR